jgi:hypothetical protein
VGSPVYADFPAKKVSLKPSAPCCSITGVSGAPAAGTRPYSPVDSARGAPVAGARQVQPNTPPDGATGMQPFSPVDSLRSK